MFALDRTIWSKILHIRVIFNTVLIRGSRVISISYLSTAFISLHIEYCNMRVTYRHGFSHHASTFNSVVNLSPDEAQNQLIEQGMAVEFKGHVARLHREMIALLPKYCLSEKLQKQLRNLSASNGPDGRSVHVCIQLAIEEVTANIVSFCRTVISCKLLARYLLYFSRRRQF